jgi:hypothetical protein
MIVEVHEATGLADLMVFAPDPSSLGAALADPITTTADAAVTAVADSAVTAVADAAGDVGSGALANDLKAKYNLAVALINDLKAKYNLAVALSNELKTDTNAVVTRMNQLVTGSSGSRINNVAMGTSGGTFTLVSEIAP